MSGHRTQRLQDRVDTQADVGEDKLTGKKRVWWRKPLWDPEQDPGL